MLSFPPFYNETIKKTTATFGTLFNDISIVRSVKNNKTQTVKVPLSYSSKDKGFVRREQDPDMNNDFQSVFPRMAFNMTSLSYDPARKLNSAEFQQSYNTYQRAPIPYNITYELYIGVTNIEDGLQIIEQILPFFNPEYTVTTATFPALNLSMDIPFILESVSFDDPGADDSDFTEQRIIEWTLTFNAKAWLFGPTQTKKQIQKVDATIWMQEPLTVDTQDSNIETKVNPFTVTNESVTHTVTTVVSTPPTTQLY
jgi:hypothetical protein